MAQLWIEETSSNESTVTLRLEGELAENSIELLQRECERRLPERQVRIDLEGVTYISPKGIRTLLALARESSVELVNGTPLVEDLLRRGK